ncbi:minor capsid protein [Nonomuraea sp. ATR24]|uniref:minor capsid protein n=1 Tax=Nonomuraea sp. ATR24 TaxID=1676744 RepID=UPI0035C0CF6D
MTLLEEFGLLAAELGLGTYGLDGTIYLNTLPAAPDRCMAIARYPGPPSDSKNPWDEIRLQFRLRGPTDDLTTVENDAQAVYDHLHGLSNRTLPGGTWLELMVGAQAGPIWMDRDGNDRPNWSVNFRCDLQRPTPHRV